MDDWAFQCGYVMSAQDARYYFDTMFPGIKYEINAFAFPIREADIEASNEYIAQCIRTQAVRSGFMCIKPEYSVEYVEEMLEKHNFSGVKPYPDMVSGKKGAEVGIFDFMTRGQFALAEKLGMLVMMHLPRAGRMPDDRNVAELKEIRNEFPKLKLCIAHFGRCFTPYHFSQAIEKMGEDIHWPYFDTAAVLNPEVYELALTTLSPERILFGTDEPIFLWHGKRTWTKTGYQNLAREDFAWNTHCLLYTSRRCGIRRRRGDGRTRGGAQRQGDNRMQGQGCGDAGTNQERRDCGLLRAELLCGRLHRD